MRLILLLLCACCVHLLPAQLVGHWESRSPMPVLRSNLATTSLVVNDTPFVYCFMGLDSSKACGTGIRLESFRYNTITDSWAQIADVPDTEGRIAASASGVNGKVYLIGGYKVFSNCDEFTSPRVDIYDPLTDTWSLGDSVPIRTDDHVQVVYKDSLIFCISGWSQNTNTRFVQVYDTYLDQWQNKGNIPSLGLFGHAGGLSGDSILYLDGVRITNQFVLVNAAYLATIDSVTLNLSYTSLGMHPGDRVYRGGGFAFGGRIAFTGGTNNAYNVDGIGYNNVPSVESGRTFGYDLASGTWEDYARNPDSVMDVREIAQVNGNEFYVIGGMEANQSVTNKVSVFVIDTVLVGRNGPQPDQFQVWVHMGDVPSIRVKAPVGMELQLDLWSVEGRWLGKTKVEMEDFIWQERLAERFGSLAPGTYILTAKNGQTKQHARFVVW